MHHSRAFTLVELGFVLVAALVICLVGLVFVGGPTTRDGCGRQLQDSTQVRGTQQALILYAQNNRDMYPIPSQLDANNATIDTDDPKSKDTSANIFSILIYQGFIPTEILVSPHESNGKIAEYEGYQFDEPQAAADPKNALWDPGFTADFTTGVGSLSYAHAFPDSDRWGMTWDATQAQLANRGPEIKSVSYSAKGEPKTTPADPATNTYLIHGDRDSWSGNVGYADNHVKFENTMAPEDVEYKATNGSSKRDVLFFNEPDTGEDGNAFLAIINKASKDGRELIWD